MDREEIRYLLGSTIYARAKAYENRVQDLECETAENGVRHLSADVRGSGRNLYRTQAWPERQFRQRQLYLPFQ